MQIIEKEIKDLHPYEKNPRKNDNAVEYVAIKSDSKRIDHYEIMRDGRMRVIKRNGNNYFAKPRRHTNGYLRYSIGGKDFYIHRLVAEYFCDNPNGYKEVNHIDGNKENNNADNLEWCTRSENSKHAFQTGLRSYDELSRMAKLPRMKLRAFKPSEDPEILKILNSGISESELSRRLGISRCAIHNAKMRALRCQTN